MKALITLLLAVTCSVIGNATNNIYGDVDCDGSVTVGDITVLYNYLLNNDTSFLSTSDVDGDGYITSSDITAIYDIILNGYVPKDTIKVLAIGNSFVDDPMAYLNSLVTASGIDRNKLCVYSLVKSSSSLDYWAGVLENGDSVTITKRAGLMKMTITNAPLSEIIAQDWDVITVQQVSNLAQNPQSLNPSLTYLVNKIREHCTNNNVVVGWQQVWSYWYENDNLQSSIENWQRINEVAILTFDYGVDMIIPTGTAIQNARTTELNTPHGLTRDGKHLAYGVGRYVAACTWFEALIAPVFGVSVVGNSAIHAITDNEQVNSAYETVAVTDANRTLCQQCAVAAVSHPNELMQSGLNR